MRNIKNKNGITVIGLVITIVVMLILVGVTVTFVIGENGIISKAGKTSSTYKNELEKEKDMFGNVIDLYLQQDGDDTIAVTGISLNKETTTISMQGTERLIATIEPNNATNKNLIWSSSDTDIATVDSNGTVTVVYPGLATITVTTEDGGYSASCQVNRVLSCKRYKNQYIKWSN